MPSAKKERSRKKKQVATAPRRSLSPALCAAAARIEVANAVSDLSTGMQAFLAIDLPTPRKAKGGSDADGKSTNPEDQSVGTVVDPVHLEIRSSTSISRVDSDRMYDLLKENMYDLYALAGWDWDERKKRREMEHRQARFIIARCKGTTEKEPSTKVSDWVPDGDETVTKGPEIEPMTMGLNAPRDGDIVAGAKSMIGDGENGGRLAGFCDFRFCWDEDENEDGQGVGASNDVLYVYEIQVAPWARQRGLGRRMMQVLELLANKHGMSKVMLTVFKANKQAMSFYTKKMKYEIDDDSPSNWDRPDEVYEILSKPTRQGAARASQARKTSTLLG